MLNEYIDLLNKERAESCKLRKALIEIASILNLKDSTEYVSTDFLVTHVPQKIRQICTLPTKN
jgi:hypothetical protein